MINIKDDPRVQVLLERMAEKSLQDAAKLAEKVEKGAAKLAEKVEKDKAKLLKDCKADAQRQASEIINQNVDAAKDGGDKSLAQLLSQLKKDVLVAIKG